MTRAQHIPHLKTITDFYQQLRIGLPQGNDFALMRIEDQPVTKRMEMPLFRCNFYRVVFFCNAGVKWLLPDQQVYSSENSIYFSHPGKLESWQTSQKIYGYLLCFTESFANFNQSLELEYPFFDFEAQHLLQIASGEARVLIQQQEEMLQELEKKRPDTQAMLRLLLHRYLISVRRLYDQQLTIQSEQIKNDHRIFQRFRKEVDRYFAELAEEKVGTQASVSSIAERLHLNPSYLNSVIKGLIGKTASSFLQEKTILEAKSYLMHTNLQVTEISFRLGFANVSYFNRVFKKMTGITPSVFKKLQQ